jgi:hypothetical protein
MYYCESQQKGTRMTWEQVIAQWDGEDKTFESREKDPTRGIW